jgi:hypothetical protein
MKNLFRVALIFVILAATLAFLPSKVYAQSQIGGDSPVVFGQNYTLSSGQTIKDLIVFGGNAVIMEGSTVTGDILIFGGNLNISGTVQGGVTSFGGNVTVNDFGVIKGILNTVGGNRYISSKATVGGESSDPSQLPFRFPSLFFSPGSNINLGAGFSFLWVIFFSLLLAAIAVVITLFLPTQTNAVAKTITGEPIVSGGVGLLTLVISPAIILVLVITIVLIPLAVLFVLVFGVTLVFGWIALGLALGERMAMMFNTQWAVPVSAGIGTLVLSLITNGILAVTGAWFWTLCCLGIPIILLLNMVSLGGVVSSRYGTQIYSTKHPQPPQFHPMPPASPVGGYPASQAPAAPVAPPAPAPEPSQFPPAVPPSMPEPPAPQEPPYLPPEPPSGPSGAE